MRGLDGSISRRRWKDIPYLCLMWTPGIGMLRELIDGSRIKAMMEGIFPLYVLTVFGVIIGSLLESARSGDHLSIIKIAVCLGFTGIAYVWILRDLKMIRKYTGEPVNCKRVSRMERCLNVGVGLIFAAVIMAAFTMNAMVHGSEATPTSIMLLIFLIGAGFIGIWTISEIDIHNDDGE